MLSPLVGGEEGRFDRVVLARCSTSPVLYTMRPIHITVHTCNPIFVIRSVSDVLRAQSRFVTFYKPTLGPKYVSNRPYNEFITPTTFI